MSSVLNKMVGAFSFLQPYWHIQPPLQPPPKICSSTSAIFHLPIPPLVVHKIILTISTNISFFYISAIFHFPIFAYSCPYSTHQNYLSCLGQLASSGCVKGTMNKGILWGLTLLYSLFLLPQSIDWDKRAHNHNLTLNLFSLIPYSANTISITHILL